MWQQRKPVQAAGLFFKFTTEKPPLQLCFPEAVIHH